MDNMGLEYQKLVEKASGYLKELVPDAENITFEELGETSSLEVPANAAFIVFSYKDKTDAATTSSSLSPFLRKKFKGVYLNPETGALLAIKNRLI